ncbi:hypothetical protein BC936DRAFT_143182 [Jimgerdemannia flammicorona]|uniref:Protein kinase domain-containing protein n=1 Tax=Jimgerdemannia flammicorona TaxID=994334 RepID=A0A433DMK3_9FUNG|nr:hypothetical protein BC936DRAFT_143182 [Jimgerdemannia flammicorona]
MSNHGGDTVIKISCQDYRESNADRLHRILNSLKPVNGFQRYLPSKFERIWIDFPDSDRAIRNHLEVLGIQQLENHLVWIPPDEFTKIEFLNQGGFARVYKGITKKVISKCHVFAMKELKKPMVPELALNIFLRSEGIAVVDVYGLTQHPDTGVYLMVMAYGDGTVDTPQQIFAGFNYINFSAFIFSNVAVINFFMGINAIVVVVVAVGVFSVVTVAVVMVEEVITFAVIGIIVKLDIIVVFAVNFFDISINVNYFIIDKGTFVHSCSFCVNILAPATSVFPFAIVMVEAIVAV